jgi:hypothetical protein
LDPYGDVYKLHYNQKFDHPLIIGGWMTLQNVYHFPWNVEVSFGYYGHNFFSFLSYRNLDMVREILLYHSRSTLAKKTRCFDVTLTEEMVKKNKIVEFNLFFWSLI